MDNLFPDVSKMMEDINKATSAFQKNMANLQKNINEGFKALAEISKDLPEKTNIAQKFLAKRGWFIPFRNLPIAKINWIADCAREEESFEEIDNYLIEYIEGLTPKIKEQSKEYFEERFPILDEAFKAHEEKRYALSIPTFLSQADGIFRDLFGKDFFKNDPGERSDISQMILSRLNQGDYRVTAASLSYVFIKQLHEESTLHESFSKTKIFEDGENIETLNRHEVLHGVAKKYNTKINSTKAIGLIGLLITAKRTLIKRGAA